jgi:predicted AlkP superfamily phosphohydrolase/phosphomutase
MRTIILGFDAFDPLFFEQLLERGVLPHLSGMVEIDGYRRFEIANPPQSEVSWTSIATGLNPGEHGIFDFVHRDPETYTPYVSLLPTKQALGGSQYISPFSARTIFDQVVRNGYPATSLWWPATFPARPESPVATIPGLGTPDIHGKLGVGILYSTENLSGWKGKTCVEHLNPIGKGRFSDLLIGPSRKKGNNEDSTSLPFELEIIDDQRVHLKLGKYSFELMKGEWSPIIELSFKIGPLIKIHALTRVIVSSLNPHLNLYFLPLQIHPLHSPWQYATPPKFVKDTWKVNGPFLTIGWPQDTTGLEDACINDEQFLDLCDSIFQTRERIFMQKLSMFEEGLLAAVFDSLDRIQHMFWRNDPEIIERWYKKLDGLVGRVKDWIKQQGPSQIRLLVVSDHGFADFSRKVHLNRWLIDNDYLVPKNDQTAGKFSDVNWETSQAYGLGLNSIYLNKIGREGKGCVDSNQVKSLTEQIKLQLLAWKTPGGENVIQSVMTNSEAFMGSMSQYGPDLVLGYSPDFRASAQTGLGEWETQSIEQNRDHWNADHCIDPKAVPGVLFSNLGLTNFSNPSYKDIPLLAIDEGIEAGEGKPPPSFSDEDKEVLEERLKSLGYL